MSILNLVRDYGVNPCIVRMQTDDSYTTMTTAGYLISQMVAFNSINSGTFQWSVSDMILCYYPQGWAFFTLSSDMSSLLPYAEMLPVPSIDSAVLVTSNTGHPVWAGPLGNGQLIIGGNGKTPSVASLIGGTGVTITPGSNTITISATGGSGIATIEGDTGSITGGTVSFNAATSGLSFSGLGTVMTLAGVLLGKNGGTGLDNIGLTIDLSGGSTGYLLTSDSSGNATWVPLDTAGLVTSVIGTAAQVLVNGTSGSPHTGTITLTLPQPIATTSSPTFNALTLTTPLTGANGGTGIANTGLSINLAAGTTGYVLTSDSSGNAGWRPPSHLTSTTYVSSSPYAVLTSDDILLMDTALFAAPMSVVLLASPSIDGQVWTVKDWSGQASAFNITVTVSGSANPIDGGTSFILTNDYESVSFAYSVSQGTYSILDEADIAASGINLFGDTGSISGTNINLQAFSDPNFPNQSGSSVTFFADRTTTPETMVLSLSDSLSNTILGISAGNGSITGAQNVGLGALSIGSATSALNNVGLGYSALGAILTGGYNIAVGHGAGNNYTGAEQANILLASPGVLGESNIMRLGNTTGTGTTGINKTYICGITGATPVSVNTPQVVLCDNGNNITVITSSTSGHVLTSNGSATPSFKAPTVPAPSTTYVNTTPYIVLLTDDIILVDTLAIGAPSSVVLPSSPAQDGQVWTIKDFGDDANNFPITVTVAGATNPIDGGTSATIDVAYESLSFAYSVSQGNYNIVYGENQGLMLTNDTGFSLGTNIDLNAGNSTRVSGSTVSFIGNGLVQTQLNVTDVNNNVIIGKNSGSLSMTGSGNAGLGKSVLGIISSGSDNVGIGTLVLNVLTTGSNNIALGIHAGSSYTSSESSNILLNSTGVITESNTLRIGTSTGTGPQALNHVYIHGINGATPVSLGVPQVVCCDNSSNLAVIPSSTSGFVLTSNGSATPSFQASAVTTLDGDTGTASGAVINVIANTASLNCGSSVNFAGDNANTLTLNVTDTNLNTIIGSSSGNASITGTDNTGLGSDVLASINSGSQNLAIGNASLLTSIADSNNVVIGFNALTLLNGGSFNTTIGSTTAVKLLTGSNNLLIGYLAGNSYTTSESSNININTNGIELAGESNTLRIGSGTGTGTAQLNHTYISGITGATPSVVHTPQVVLCDNANNLAVISSGTVGFVLTSNGSAPPSFQAASVGVSWIDQTTTPVSPAIINTGYVTDHGATQVVYTLPSAPALGSIIRVSGLSAGGWQILPGAGDTIQIGSVNAATSVTSANQYDTIELLYTGVANALWVLQSGVTAGYIIV